MVTAELGACEWFVYELRRSNLIDRGQLDQLVGDFLKRNPRAEAADLARCLIDQNALTVFQAERVLNNKSQGLVLGPYVLTDSIGSGSMGTVYKALSKTDNHHYAVKVLPRRSMWNVRLARRQVRAFGQFSHPTVVPFVDVGTSGGMHYLVWPFIDGEPLENVVQRMGKLPAQQTAQIGVQIANGLMACHSHNLFHGLIKPSNIMVRSENQIAILDFGIGSLLAENEGESLVDTMSTANTLTSGLDCASPESIMEPTNRTPVGDQYSLGCTLYYCLTGRYPFPDGSAVEKMMSHQFKEPESLKTLAPDAPDELIATIEKLMAKKPEERFGGADEVASRLLPLAGGLPVDGAFSGAALPTGTASARSTTKRPSSIVLPPPTARPGSKARQSTVQPAPLTQPVANNATPILPEEPPLVTPAPAMADFRRISRNELSQQQPAADGFYRSPPGFVPEQPRGPQFGPLAVAAIGLCAMILSYITFLTINPFK